MKLNLLSEVKCFSGLQRIYSHHSNIIGASMKFGIYLPPQMLTPSEPIPVLYWLSGLTCTEENFIIKAGAQRVASKLGIAIVTPDTSPRDLNIPHDKENYDFGEGASFYVDAKLSPWKQYYKMYSYIVSELVQLLPKHFLLDYNRTGIFGHSMGGHGALMIALKNPEMFKSVSAFSPICSPTHAPWGIKAFTGYLGDDRLTWQLYDASYLMASVGWPNGTILIDQGTQDAYLETQLQPQYFVKACQKAHIHLDLRMQAGYDHSYYFISTFIEDHLHFHRQRMMAVR